MQDIDFSHHKEITPKIVDYKYKQEEHYKNFAKM